MGIRKFQKQPKNKIAFSEYHAQVCDRGTTRAFEDLQKFLERNYQKKKIDLDFVEKVRNQIFWKYLTTDA